MKVAVLIPAFNEESTIASVISAFRKELPEAAIWVGDNDSADRTAEAARAAGAAVIRENRPGKGYVLRSLLENADADILVMVDGDDTYRAGDVHALIEPVRDGECDMCIGNRLRHYRPGSFSRFHLFGNRLIRTLTYRLHGVNIPDMLTGYRAVNRRLAEELCLIMGGFEIETEINIKSVWHGARIRSVDIEYRPRPPGSISKIKTFHDGYRILATILMLLRERQPMTMGGVVFLGLNAAGAVLFLWGLALPNLYLFSSGLFLSLLGVIALSLGIILHAVNISHREVESRFRKILKQQRETSP